MADQKLRILLEADSSKLSKGLDKAGSKLQAFGAKTQAVGKNLSTKLTLPLALAGGAALKLGVDFDKSMTKIQSLVGVAAADVDKMGETAKKMATDTGKSAAEAAEALFFITSAGLRGKEATDVLNASLKAAAVGLGETATVADLATSAMNAYGSANLNAEAATDVMVSAVREGKLEASELAQSMGAVLPVASNMGVKFHEVGAAFAALSRTGTGAAEAATQIRSILTSLLKPTKQAEDQLSALGLSSAGLRQSLKEDGLLATLEILKQKFEGNDTAAQNVFGNVRALSGVMDLLGAGVDSTRAIFDAMNDTQGATAKAFEATSESASFKLTKGLNSVKIALTEVGAVLLDSLVPLIEGFTKTVITITKKFNELDKSTKKIILAIGGIAAVIGPILIVIGKMSIGFGALIKALPLVAGGFRLLTAAMIANPILAVATAIAAVTVAIVKYKKSQKEANKVALEQMNAAQLGEKIEALEKRKQALYKRGYKDGQHRVQIVQDEIDVYKKQIQVVNEATKANEELEKQRLETSNTPAPTALPTMGGGETRKPIAAVSALGATAGTTMGTTQQLNLDPGSSLLGEMQTVNTDPVAMLAASVAGSTEELSSRLTAANEVLRAKGLEQQMIAQENALAVGAIVTGGLQGIAAGMGEALGEAIANGGNLVGALASTMLTGLANMAIQMGKLVLANGIAIEAIKEALTSLSGPLAIAAGIALIAIGSAVKAGAANIGKGKGKGGSGGGQSGPRSGAVAAFANGGIVSGPTLGLMGEYAGAKSNPEVIAPLDKLKNMIGSRQAQQVNVGGEFRLNGQDLVVALQRAEKQRGRIK
jgi:TP901 family phage tail tape measure protein